MNQLNEAMALLVSGIRMGSELRFHEGNKPEYDPADNCQCICIEHFRQQRTWVSFCLIVFPLFRQLNIPSSPTTKFVQNLLFPLILQVHAGYLVMKYTIHVKVGQHLDLFWYFLSVVIFHFIVFKLRFIVYVLATTFHRFLFFWLFHIVFLFIWYVY